MELDLSDCAALEELPPSIGGLAHLVRLELGFCQQLTGLPEALGNLTGLVELDLQWLGPCCPSPLSLSCRASCCMDSSEALSHKAVPQGALLSRLDTSLL